METVLKPVCVCAPLPLTGKKEDILDFIQKAGARRRICKNTIKDSFLATYFSTNCRWLSLLYSKKRVSTYVGEIYGPLSAGVDSGALVIALTKPPIRL